MARMVRRIRKRASLCLRRRETPDASFPVAKPIDTGVTKPDPIGERSFVGRVAGRGGPFNGAVGCWPRQLRRPRPLPQQMLRLVALDARLRLLQH